ncbi:MAG: hypothetical protein ACTSQH_07550 [Candidatus Hodarchaeales archaeon]
MGESGGLMSGFMKGFDKIFKGFKMAMGPIGMLINFLDAMGVIQPILDIFTAFLEIMGAEFTPIIISLTDNLLTLLPLASLLGDALFSIFEPFLPLIPALVGVMSPLLTLFTDLTNAVLIPLLPYITDLVNFLTNLFSGISTFIPNIPSVLEDGFHKVLEWFGGIWDRIIERIEDTFTGIIGNIVDFFTG